MKSDSDIQSNCCDFNNKIQEIKTQIEDFQYNPKLVQTPEELESLEQEIGKLVNALPLQRHLFHNLSFLFPV